MEELGNVSSAFMLKISCFLGEFEFLLNQLQLSFPPRPPPSIHRPKLCISRWLRSELLRNIRARQEEKFSIWATEELSGDRTMTDSQAPQKAVLPTAGGLNSLPPPVIKGWVKVAGGNSTEYLIPEILPPKLCRVFGELHGLLRMGSSWG